MRLCSALLKLRRSVRISILKENKESKDQVVQEIEAVDTQRRDFLDLHLLPDLSKICLEYVPDFFCHSDDLGAILFHDGSDEGSRDAFPRARARDRVPASSVHFSLDCLSSL
jgi:hypothetical protein